MEKNEKKPVIFNSQGDPGSDQKNFLPLIKVLSESFEMPQVFKTRRIAALLPHDYESSDRRYPVLYLQDGQNLYDEHAPFGNWGVDKKLAALRQKGLGDLIVIAIDHAEEDRIKEFTPSQKTRLGRGHGKKYLQFLTETLKPYVDSHFRTIPDLAHTGIGGSSMGGLISIYAGQLYPGVFSKLMIFSPSLWVSPKLSLNQNTWQGKLYLYAGELEGQEMMSHIHRFKKSLDQNNIDFKLSIDPEGRHNEFYWGQEFPKALEYLFG